MRDLACPNGAKDDYPEHACAHTQNDLHAILQSIDLADFMISNAKIPWEMRLGGISGDEISARLRLFSNPVKYGKEEDVGIDFYCELLENETPTPIHFYVQAKGTQHFDDNWGAGVRKSTIAYWLGKSFPVFLVVYDEPSRICYWMSIEDQRYNLLPKLLEADSDTIYLKMDRSNILKVRRNENDDFIKKVKEDLDSIRLFQGYPQFKGEGYEKKVPDEPRSLLELESIKEQVRAGMYSLIRHWLPKDLKKAYHCCKFLSEFDLSHYNHFVWLGFIYEAFGDKSSAKENFQKALEICKRDTHWERRSMERLIAMISQEIERL